MVPTLFYERIELALFSRQCLEPTLATECKADPVADFNDLRLGELALAANRLEDARRAFLQSYDLRPLPATARSLAELAQRRGNSAEARAWQERAGTVERPNQPPPADP